MAKEPVYLPLFTRLPESLDERWTLLKRFFEAWGNPVEEPELIAEGRFEEAETRLGKPVPDAVRGYYREGFYDVFRSRSSEPEQWVPLDELTVDEASGGVRFVNPDSAYDSGRAIPIDAMDQDDPPVMDDVPEGSLDDVPAGLNPTGLSFSAWLIREALGMAQDLTEHRRSMESDTYRRAVKRFRRTFAKADVDGRQGDQVFTFYEAEDAVYYEINYPVLGWEQFYALIAARTADALDRHLRRGDYEIRESPRQPEFEHLFRDHLRRHEETVVAALRPVIAEAEQLPEETDAIVFRIYPYWDIFSIGYTAYESDGSEVQSDPVFGGQLLPDGPPLIPEGAIDRDWFEDAEVDTQRVGDRVLSEWFADCWGRAGGGRISKPVYIQDDSQAVFDLARKEWVELEAEWC